ncbi:MAG TPA: DNA translocase FtsK 4TM domain-containing protein [Candidatus Limnocylindrales bacterium]|nr:DNA translocase FtsK 4TM domain-containing protein [Candidatus Limnocylindrales bacterium]
MATRRRRQARRRSSSGMPSIRLPDVGAEVARSLVGITLLVLGAITLIAFLPGEGSVTTWFRDIVGPWFGTLRWLLPFLLLATGWYIEWGPGKSPGSGWGLTLLGVVIAYVGLLGAASIFKPTQLGVSASGGGIVGKVLSDILKGLITPVGAFILFVAIGIAGVLIAFNLRLSQLMRPVTSTARWVGSSAADSMRRVPPPDPANSTRGANGKAGAPTSPTAEVGVRSGGRVRGGRIAGAPGEAAGQTGLFGEDSPAPMPSPVPTSATFAPARTPGAAGGSAATAVAERPRPLRDPDDVTDGSDSPPTKEKIEYVLPPLDLLDQAVEHANPGGDETLHLRTEDIIIKKLRSFDIEAKMVGRNAGPVVTQYEVQPAPHIKVSRIEALADDLAMALAARTLRIEAPIPGKAAVGIEIPNQDFNVVTLRGILETLDFNASGSKLTFALGRDVAGRPQAVDLAKMPHLLIAGATGSGKSVMVNALITSLLCNASPDDVRMVLVDLKRVELAAYNEIPHLLVPVITEPEKAKAALKWAVNEMEARYRRFAGATARNIRAYNDTRADPEDRMPYIVLVIDELADLMMREGKHIEDPIVRLAQKARATGIHMVLATQRPSVNVVTGLIKANFPSRIAFAMASQIDSRTILDAPGAEDLIGRGDMLYQPSDLPRPMRLQGVFVSDPEIARVTTHWKSQVDGKVLYDMAILQSDEEGSASGDELADEDADRLLPDAVEVIREYDRASASLLQRRLKVGYARAARMIDQLEQRGYIGAFDGSNARVVLRRDGGPTDNGAGPGDD